MTEHARGWWHRRHQLASAAYLDEAMFAQRYSEHLRVSIRNRDWQSRMVDDLVNWLGQKPNGIPNERRGSLPTVVRLVKDHARLSAMQKAEIAERVDRWLTARLHDADARELAGWVEALIDEAKRADPFGAGVEVGADAVARIRAMANGAPLGGHTPNPDAA